LNRQPADYKSAALPLSYVGDLLKTLFAQYFFITFIKSNQILGLTAVRSPKLKVESSSPPSSSSVSGCVTINEKPLPLQDGISLRRDGEFADQRKIISIQ
jgi:hypothetical protein